MTVYLTMKNGWDSVAFKVKETNNEETLRRLVADKLKAKEYRSFVRRSRGEYNIKFTQEPS